MNAHLLLIYLMIGFAHWCAHILECDGCKHTVINNMRFAIEGFIYVFGWPQALAKYVIETIRRPRTGLTSDQVNAQVENFMKSRLDVLEIRQLENEPDDVFEERIKNLVGGKISERRKGNQNAQP